MFKNQLIKNEISFIVKPNRQNRSTFVHLIVWKDIEESICSI